MDLELQPMDTKMFGARLKALREAKGLSQGDVAAATNGRLSRVGVSNWERGEADRVDAESLYLVCEFLGSTVAYVLYGKEPTRKPIEEIDDAWEMLTPDQRREIAEQARHQAKQNAEIAEIFKRRK